MKLIELPWKHISKLVTKIRKLPQIKARRSDSLNLTKTSYKHRMKTLSPNFKN